jgi:hypothetical protein
MSELICPRTWTRCLTATMCSPFGGCTTADHADVEALRKRIEILEAQVRRLQGYPEPPS